MLEADLIGTLRPAPRPRLRGGQPLDIQSSDEVTFTQATG